MNKHLNKCFNIECHNVAKTEFCPECLANGGVKPKDYINPRVEHRFIYHKPQKGQPEKYHAIREKAKELAHMIDELCQNKREKEFAMINLEQAVMWANASIARFEGGENE